MGEEFSFEDALIILKRRFLYFLAPTLLVAVIGVVTVMLLPAQYTARGTILVESQQIPDEYIRSTINAYAQERIQTIRQRVMTRNRLLEVADKHSVFPRSSGLSESERTEIMRRRLNVSLITIDGNRRAQRDGTIAFTVSYTDPSPQTAYLVANEFMTLFLSEDVRARTAGASNTTEFFDREATRLRNAVAEMENRIADFKAENANALPDHLNMHLDLLERATQNYNASQRSLSELEEEKRFLETQLVSGAASNNSMAQEIAQLESELARLRASYHDSFPAVQAKKDEIAALKRQMAPSAEFQHLRERLKEAEAALVEAENAKPQDAEAVAAAETRLQEAQEALSAKISEATRSGALDNTGVQIESRLALIENRIRMTKRQLAAQEEQIAEYQKRIAETPAVERQLASLTRDYENMFSEYQDLLAKRQDAQLAENLEQNQQAEKFSILEPALRPDEPSSPDRPKLIVLALFVALAAGGGVALIAELLFATVRGRDHVARVLDEHPIAVVPYIYSEDDRMPGLSFFRRRKALRPSPEPA